MNLKLLAAGAVAASALIGTASASAAATVDSVDVYKHRGGVEIDVNTVRGTATVAPRVTARVGTRAAELATVGWDALAAPADLTLSQGELELRSAVAVGDTLTLTIRVCDDDCVTQTVDAVVQPGGNAYGRGEHGDDEAEAGDDHGDHRGHHGAPPLPEGAVTSDVAVANALAANAGATLVEVHRTCKEGAVWDVELLAADGTTPIEVLIAADGSIVAPTPAVTATAKAKAKAKAAAKRRAAKAKAAAKRRAAKAKAAKARALHVRR